MRSVKKTMTWLICLFTACSFAQNSSSLNARFKDGLKIYMSDDSTRYVKATGLAQIWVRYNDNNPGSTVNGTPEKETFDVGLRRMRYQVLAQVNKKVFFYSQIGINSFNNLSARKAQIFFHDVTGEYAVYKNYLTIGTGLSGWNGTARFTSSGLSSILALDLPYEMETTNDVTDQFVRRLGVYAKGKIGGFDYRLSAANPFPVQTAASVPGAAAVATLPATGTNTSYYSTRNPELLYQSYFMWQFLDKESNQLPYMAGSYLGKKRVLSVGAGFAYQKDAMWYRSDNATGDTISTPIQQFGVDVFYDSYLNKEKQNAITAYAAFLHYDYGPNYIRNTGPMNTANGVIAAFASFNGAGSNAPVYGTGKAVYAQAGYLFRKDLLKSEGTLQPYITGYFAQLDRLKDPVLLWDVGVNWIQGGQNSKFSLDYQSRPIFHTDSNGDIRETKSARRGMVVLQYQIGF